VAGRLAPSGKVMVISSSRRIVCCAVTITPGLQITPLEENRGRACTATTDRPARSTAAAKSFDNAAHSFAILKIPPCFQNAAWAAILPIARSARQIPGNSAESPPDYYNEDVAQHPIAGDFPMTIDERLVRVLLEASAQDAENNRARARIAELHHQRLERLEGDR
jgi:hypothetical protein